MSCSGNPSWLCSPLCRWLCHPLCRSTTWLCRSLSDSPLPDVLQPYEHTMYARTFGWISLCNTDLWHSVLKHVFIWTWHIPNHKSTQKVGMIHHHEPLGQLPWGRHMGIWGRLRWFTGYYSNPLITQSTSQGIKEVNPYRLYRAGAMVGWGMCVLEYKYMYNTMQAWEAASSGCQRKSPCP
jgi:hypothetical protein